MGSCGKGFYFPVALYHTMMTLDSPEEKAFINMGKGENAGNQHFLLFQLCFLSYERQIHCLD